MENWDEEPEKSFQEKLESAVYAGNVGQVRESLKIQGLESFEDGGFRLLTTALYYKHHFLACLLINAGANLDDENSEIPLIHQACNNRTLQKASSETQIYREGSLEVIKCLLEKNCKINAIDVSRGGQSALALTTASQDFEAMNLLVEYGAEIDIPDFYGKTPLYIAIKDRYISGMNLLTQVGADLTLISKYGSLLHVAVNDPDFEISYNLPDCELIIDILLDEGLSINFRDRMRQTPLHISKNLEITKLLLKKQCDINAQNVNGETPLMIAVQNNRRKIVDLLLSEGADPNLKTVDDRTCLYIAVQKGNDSMVSTLIKYKADLNITCKGESILLTSLKTSYSHVTQILHDHFESWDCDNPIPVTEYELLSVLDTYPKDLTFNRLLQQILSTWNFTADVTNESRFIFKAAYLGLNNVVEKFLSAGYNVNSIRRDVYFGREADYSLLHIAILDQNIALIQILLNQGADIDVKDERGYSLLHMALLKEGSYSSDSVEKLVTVLVEAGIDINAETDDGYTILHLASYAGNRELVEYLVKAHKFDVNKKTKNDVTALHLAVREGWLSVVSCLLENGANPKIQMEGGLVALSIAVLKNRPMIVKKLLEHGVDMNAEDDFGRDALKLAVWIGSLYYVEELLQFGANPYLEDYKGRNTRDLACTYTNYYDEADKETEVILEMFTPNVKDGLASEKRDSNGVSNSDHDCHDIDYVICPRYCVWLGYYPWQIPEVLEGYNNLAELLKIVSAKDVKKLADEDLPLPIITEMQSMWLDKVAVCLTVRDIVVEPVAKLAKKMKNLKGFRNLNPCKLDQTYPVFKGMLRKRLAEVWEYDELVNKAMEALRVVTRVNIPDLAGVVILNDFENVDLKRLVKAVFV